LGYLRNVTDIAVPVWTLGDRLLKSRKQADLEQTEMADFLGVSTGSISLWEHDKRTPRVGMLRLWSQRCAVPFGWLRYGDAWTPTGDGGSVTDESWSACTTRLPEEQEELPFGETIEVPAALEPDRTVVPFRRAS
jgi:transcriptional regulator with XRE-family HTH domain